jgi:hypothetical protein
MLTYTESLEKEFFIPVSAKLACYVSLIFSRPLFEDEPMTEAVSPEPKPKKSLKRRLLEGVLVAGGAVVALGYLAGPGPALRLQRQGYNGATIMNVGTKEITINKIVANAREDCRPMSTDDAPFKAPKSLKVGEFAWFKVITCGELVRVEIQTSDGTGTYHFD